MTKMECAIVTAFTGVSMLKGRDLKIFQNYIETKLGRPVYTHELASAEMEHIIKEVSRDDFMELCKKATK